ncbi:MAG: anhydro-N-acetylmuramic acid kinase, partial [Gammaproteobacteria bacterium]
DTVLTAFHADGRIQDLHNHFVPFEDTFYQAIRALQHSVAQYAGHMETVAEQFHCSIAGISYSFDRLQRELIDLVADSINALIIKARAHPPPYPTPDGLFPPVDIIGFHGQTCDHCPPSRLGANDSKRVYTVQIGDGQRLADLTGITVACDFRSDDLMAGGEAAPLAPMHNLHLTNNARPSERIPIVFCNAGNTGNLSLISTAQLSHSAHQSYHPFLTYGWDTGPFNHYPDHLMRKYRNQPCDLDGRLGAQGHINLTLLATLFSHSVKHVTGDNYLLMSPPKSGDPNFYTWLPALDDDTLPLADRVRTAEYFAAYAFTHSLSFIPEHVQVPTHFALFGGGWSNPIIRQHFEGILKGKFQENPILPTHHTTFQHTLSRLHMNKNSIFITKTETFGINSQAMEARVFADMARCRLMGIPFSTPEITGVSSPTVGGILRFPQQTASNATSNVRAHLIEYSMKGPAQNPITTDTRWSRASAG